MVFDKIQDLQNYLNIKRNEGSIGFVPTMGALHDGHLSLVRKSVEENATTVVSVYVNPTQFNDKSDLERYPRNLANDIELLSTAGCELVFAPTDNEMYPVPDTRIFNFGELESVMEGKHRKGHFNGVGQIVSKLFDAVMPNKAYFGLKDFQQLAIIRKLVRDYKYDIDIIACPIAREADGLAMSSRNMLLEPEMRKSSPFIYKTLKEVVQLAGSNSVSELKEYVKTQFENHEMLDLEYFEIIHDTTLQPIADFNPEIAATACIAVYAGKIRLIDNIQFNS